MEIDHGKTMVTTEDLARMFVDAGNDEQAEFINLIGKEFKKATKRWKEQRDKKNGFHFFVGAEMQCCYISDCIDQDGKDFIYCLANFLRLKGQGDQRYSEFYRGESLVRS